MPSLRQRVPPLFDHVRATPTNVTNWSAYCSSKFQEPLLLGKATRIFQWPTADTPARTCDACRKSLNSCDLRQGKQQCVFCGVFEQECTFVEEEEDRKRVSGKAAMREEVMKGMELYIRQLGSLIAEGPVKKRKRNLIENESALRSCPQSKGDRNTNIGHNRCNSIKANMSPAVDVLQPRKISFCSESEVSDNMEALSEDCEVNRIDDMGTQKEQMLDRLMVCVHELFAVTGVSTRTGHTSSTTSSPSKQNNEAPGSGSKNIGGKRKRDQRDKDGDGGEDNDDKSGKRQSMLDAHTEPQENDKRRLACPYYKQNPRKQYPSRACCGPGWTSVHRIKYALIFPL
jgi:hypothetical protein